MDGSHDRPSGNETGGRYSRAAGKGVIHMGNRGGEQTLGENSGCLEEGRRVAGGGDRQLWTKRVKLLADVRNKEVVRSGCVRVLT